MAVPKTQCAQVPSQTGRAFGCLLGLIAVENLTTIQGFLREARVHDSARRHTSRFDAATMACRSYSEQPRLGLRVVAFTGIKDCDDFRPAFWQPLRGIV